MEFRPRTVEEQFESGIRPRENFVTKIILSAFAVIVVYDLTRRLFSKSVATWQDFAEKLRDRWTAAV
jgi:hypothetical protein